jgi:hypothetical protein
MSRKRRVTCYTPVPFPADPEPPDVSIGQAMWFGGWSQRQTFRLIESGEIQTFKFGGKRRVVFESLKQFRARCLALGPQLGERRSTRKRRVGRPSKPSPAVSP